MSRALSLQGFLDRAPIARFLGMKCDIKGDEMTAILPFQDKFIGNFAVGALHGGCMGMFLEMTAMAQVFLSTELERPPKTIDLTIDYLRTGKATDLYARATIQKMGRRIASVRAEAWQSNRDKPVSALQAHFLVAQDPRTP